MELSHEPSTGFLVKDYGVLAQEHYPGHMNVNMVASFSCVLVSLEVVKDKGSSAALPV